MTDTLFSDSEVPTVPALGLAATLERLVAVMVKENYFAGHTKLGADDLRGIAHMVLSSLYGAGLEISDRGRTADLKAALSDWLTLAADNAACGEESVDFEELQARTRRLIGVTK